ncbi:MAG TPA: hypothetical protein VKX49_23015 [Bryobacteraceae bacterium]|nr:hypothetical protein [Bryobacteraceae bacterium]
MPLCRALGSATKPRRACCFALTLTQVQPIEDVLEAHKTFDKREEGWIKVELKTAA